MDLTTSKIIERFQIIAQSKYDLTSAPNFNSIMPDHNPMSIPIGINTRM